MRVKVIENHDGEGNFPTFKKGMKVDIVEACSHYLHWYACNIQGYKTYIPSNYVDEEKLLCDYNPTELKQKENDILIVKEIVYAWLVVENEKEEIGWFPAEKVLSI